MIKSSFVFRQFAFCLAAAATVGAQATVPDTVGTDIVTTRGQVTTDGKVLRYTARAGHIAIRDNEAGDVHGNMFFVSYTLDQAPGARPRPLTFVWNGGPGSNSGLVHLLGFGPKRITAATGSMPRFSPWGTALVDNRDPRCGDIAIHRAVIADVDLLAGGHVAGHLAEHDDGLGEDLGLDPAVGADGEHVLAELDLAFDLTLDGQILAAVQLALDDDGLSNVHS